MGQWEEKLGAILNNPQAMGQIMSLAQSLGGQGETQDAPDTHGLRIISPGLALAKVLNGRLEPCHQAAMALSNLPGAELSEESALAFARGEAVPWEGSGWLTARFRGMPLGWGKASGGMLKNHLPKGLRRDIEL